MSRRGLLTGLIVIALSLFGVAAAQAAPEPMAAVKATWGDTNLPPGGAGVFTVQARNIGEADFSPGLNIIDELPAGVTATRILWGQDKEENVYGQCEKLSWAFCEAEFGISPNCTGLGTETVRCELVERDVSFFGQGKAPVNSKGYSFAEPTGYLPPIFIEVAVDHGASETEPGANIARVEGGGVAQAATDVDTVDFSQTPSSFGVVPGSFESDVFNRAYPFGERSRQAGDHPFEQRVNFDLNAATAVSADDGTREAFSNGLVKTIEVTLPRGLIGNPEALPKCDPVDFAQAGATLNATTCPPSTQVGYLNIQVLELGSHSGQGCCLKNAIATRVALYNLVPPKGTPVDLAFDAGGFVQGHIYATLDPSQGYAIKSVTPNISALLNVRGSEVTLWGVPGDPAHSKFRYFVGPPETDPAFGAPFSAPILPFLTSPMDCGFDNGGVKLRVDSYQNPGQLTAAQEDSHPVDVKGCDDPRFQFEPQTSLQPTSRAAGGPTGLEVHLEVPQRNEEVNEASKLYAEEKFVQGISTPPMKKVVVTFPEGMTLNPSAAQGLGTCSAAQIGLGTDSPVTCPDNSQYGTLTLHTPILPLNAQPEGQIYVAKQTENPFRNFLSFYMVIQEPERGILVKIPFKAELDPLTGRITGTLDDLPQFPVSDFQMTLKGGVRAGLVNPTTCGTKVITAEFFTWQDPSVPHTKTSSYDITQKPDGSPCVNNLGERPFKPLFEAGTTNNTAGGYAPFAFQLTRGDDDQEFSQVGITLPPGLAAKFAGVVICPDAGIARALSRETVAGDGALEQADPSCPASSQIGTTEVGTGVGVPLTYVPGKVYLAGPYHGAPISLVVISPAIVGPYDLGVITVRTALNVNPETAQGSALTDPLPQIFQGVPVRIRDIRLDLDRPGFSLNPTSCTEKQIRAHVTGTGANVASTADDTGADLSERFQAADCASLGFKPSLGFHLRGSTHRGGHPKLKAVVTYPKKGAYSNIAAASVSLPPSEFLDEAHIVTVCTRVQFAAKACPSGSVYGEAEAKTPLFEQPLKGPVYLRSNGGERLLPDLVAALRGPASQPVEVDLVGHIDSIRGGIRNTFEVVPDAPVTKFTLSLKGGNKGLLINSINLCSKDNRTTAKLRSQSGVELTTHPLLRTRCGKVKKKAHKSRAH
jgi:hypothetical protein